METGNGAGEVERQHTPSLLYICMYNYSITHRFPEHYSVALGPGYLKVINKTGERRAVVVVVIFELE